jgi:hypothetical protein
VVTRYVTAEVVVGPEDSLKTAEHLLQRVLTSRAAALPGEMVCCGKWTRLPDERIDESRTLARATVEVVPMTPPPRFEHKESPPRKKGARR